MPDNADNVVVVVFVAVVVVEQVYHVLKLRSNALRHVAVPQLQLRPTAHFVRPCVRPCVCEISYFPPKDFANFWSEVRGD